MRVYITEVERQLDIKVKVVRSNRGGEYYGKYDESGQCLRPCAKFVEKHGIRAQYTILRTPQQMVLLKSKIVLYLKWLEVC